MTHSLWTKKDSSIPASSTQKHTTSFPHALERIMTNINFRDWNQSHDYTVQWHTFVRNILMSVRHKEHQTNLSQWLQKCSGCRNGGNKMWKWRGNATKTKKKMCYMLFNVWHIQPSVCGILTTEAFDQQLVA